MSATTLKTPPHLDSSLSLLPVSFPEDAFPASRPDHPQIRHQNFSDRDFFNVIAGFRGLLISCLFPRDWHHVNPGPCLSAPKTLPSGRKNFGFLTSEISKNDNIAPFSFRQHCAVGNAAPSVTTLKCRATSPKAKALGEALNTTKRGWFIPTLKKSYCSTG